MFCKSSRQATKPSICEIRLALTIPKNHDLIKQVGCDPADHKKWGGACAATCIEVVPNVVRAIQGGLRPPYTPPLLRLHSPCHTIPCLKLFACQWCVRPPMYTSTAVCSRVSEQSRGAAIHLNCSSERLSSIRPSTTLNHHY